MTTKPELLDHTPLTFGKYGPKRQGGALTPDAVAEIDPEYVVWMFDNVTDFPTCSRLLADECRQDLYEDDPDEDSPPWE